MIHLLRVCAFFLFVLVYSQCISQPLPRHHLHFDSLATSWDEAIPLGNATLGALVWQKEGELRFSLDRADCGTYDR